MELMLQKQKRLAQKAQHIRFHKGFYFWGDMLLEPRGYPPSITPHSIMFYNLQTGWTPLMIASRNGLLEIVKLMVDTIMKFPEAKKQEALDQARKVSGLYLQ